MTQQRLRRRSRSRERSDNLRRLLTKHGGNRGIKIAQALAEQQQQTIQPSTAPAIPPAAQAQFEAEQTAQRTAETPLGEIQVGAATAAPDTRGKPEFGSFFGSGVLENVVGAALPALENLQKGIETVGGAVTATAGQLTPGDLFGFEGNLRDVQEESGRSGFFDIAGQAQDLAETFRRTNFPTTQISLPGGGINLPGDATLDDIDIGVKGAIELIPEIVLGIATGGTSAAGSLGKRTLVSAANALGADIAKAVVKSGAKAVTSSAKVAKAAKNVPVDSLVESAGTVAKSVYSQVSREIDRVSSPELRATIDKLPIGFKHAVTTFWSAANPVKIADTSRAAVKGVYTYVRVLDRNNILRERNVADFVSRVGLGSLPEITNSVTGKIPGKPFAVTEGGLMHNTGFKSIDESGKSWTEVFENLFEGDALDETARTATRKDVYGDIDVGVWNPEGGSGLGAYEGGAGSELATFVRHYQDSVEGMALHFTNVGGKIPETVILDYANSRYVPRDAVTGISAYADADELNKFSRTKRAPGAKQRPLSERTNTNESIAERIEKGEYKLAGPMETLNEHIRSMYKASLDVENTQFMKAQALKANSGVFNLLPAKAKVASLIGRLGKGQKTITEPLLNQIGKDFPTVRRALEDAVKITDSEARSQVLESIKKSFSEEIIELSNQYYVPSSSGAVRGGKKIPKSERFPGYVGLLFEDKAEADLISRLSNVGTESAGRQFSRWAAEAGDLFRLGRVGFDFGFHLIQGIPFLGFAAGRFAKNPVQGGKLFKEWGKSIGVAATATVKPDRMIRIMIDDIDIVTEGISNGLQMSRQATDVFQAIQGGTFLRKIPKAGETLDDLIVTAAKPFERAFVAPGDYLRLQGYKIMRDSAALKGQQGLEELAASLNNMTGALSSNALGLNPTLQQIERGFLFFSPRYTRSSLALMSDVFSGNLQGKIARESIIGMLGFGMLTYIATVNAINLAGGKQELHLDPSKSSFLSLNINDDKIGIGSFWMQSAKLASRLASTAWDEDAREAFGGTEPGGRGVLRSNQIVRWVRSRGTPISGFGWDIATGEDFLGRQLQGPADWTKHTVLQATPIWVEAGFLSDPYATGKVGIAGEVLGGNIRALTASERRRDLRDALAVDIYGKEWNDINGLQRDRINNGDGVAQAQTTNLEQLNEIVSAERAKSGVENDQSVDLYHREQDRVQEEWQANLQPALDFLEAGAIDLRDFRNIHLNKANAIRRDALAKLNDEEGEFADAIAYFERNAERFGEDKPEDVAYNEYIAKIIGTDAFDDPRGFNFSKRDEEVAVFQQKWGDEVFAYVQERFSTGRTLPGIVNEFYQGRKRFEYYWNDLVEQTIASMPFSEDLRATYDIYLKATANEKFEMEATDRRLKALLNKMGSVRVELRKRDQLLDAWLFRWGYTNTMQNRENKFSPDGFDDARDYWRMPSPLPVFATESGVAL